MVRLRIVFTILILINISCNKKQVEDAPSDEASSAKETFQNPEEQKFIETLKKSKLGIKKKNNIFFIITDTLRKDKVTQELAPTLWDFKRKEFSFDQAISGASNTHHSFFSIFFSRPAYERYDYWRENWSIGSPLLRVLKLLGYNIYAFGPNDIFHCKEDDENLSVKARLSEQGQGNLLFGQENPLLSSCSKKYGYNSDFHRPHIMDEDTLQQVVEKINTLQSPSQQNFFLIYFYSNHYAYGFKHNNPRNRKPFIKDYKNVEFKNPAGTLLFKYSRYNYTTDAEYQLFKKKLIHSYENSVIFVDSLVNTIFETLKKKNLYDDSIIVFTADHGEDLFDYDPDSLKLHGAIHPYSHQIEVPIIYKFPDKDKSKIPYRNKIGYTLDIFPTLLDYLGLNDSSDEAFDLEIEKMMYGNSIFKKDEQKDCLISTRPNMENRVKHMAFYDFKTKHKAFWEREEEGQDEEKRLFDVSLREVTKLNDEEIVAEGLSREDKDKFAKKYAHCFDVSKKSLFTFPSKFTLE